MTLKTIARENKATTLLLAASFVAATGFGSLYFRLGGDSLPLFLIFMAAAVWLIVQYRMFLKILDKYAWKNPVTMRIGKIFGGVFKLLFAALVVVFAPVLRGLQRIQLPKWRDINRITLFQDEKIRLFSDKRRNPFRIMKWKSLLNHRERVRFIYISFLQKKIKKGAIVLPSDTPSELNVKLNAGDDLSAQLFALYNVARYADEDIVVEKAEVEAILPCASKRLRF